MPSPTGHAIVAARLTTQSGFSAPECGASRARQPVEPIAAQELDRGRDRRKHRLVVVVRDDRRKAVRKFLGDEAGREPALAPARMPHQGGEERDVVLDAVDHEVVERLGHGVDRCERVGAQVQSLAIIGS